MIDVVFNSFVNLIRVGRSITSLGRREDASLAVVKFTVLVTTSTTTGRCYSRVLKTDKLLEEQGRQQMFDAPIHAACTEF